jgi:hypothetical protein
MKSLRRLFGKGDSNSDTVQCYICHKITLKKNALCNISRLAEKERAGVADPERDCWHCIECMQ